MDFKLNDEQVKAVLDINGHILVIAGAGSGKTRVLTARICYLLELGVNPDDILAITFTNKAAQEMKDRICQSTPLGEYIWASTFHSMCAKILRVYATCLGYDNNFTIYDEEDKKKTIKRVLERIPDADTKAIKNYIDHISKAKTYGMTPQEYYEEIEPDIRNAKVIKEIFEEYEKELKISNAFDFDDLLIKCYELLSKFPDVLSVYQERFKYISVDEFQDTNMIQFNIVKLLSEKYNNLFVVGDEDQSIYGWRGSDIKNIVDFKKTFPDAKVYKLEQNYRSTPKILTVANNVISNNKYRNEKSLWTENTDDYKSVTYKINQGDKEEAEYVASQIVQLHDKGLPYNEIAVLVRATRLTRLFEERFTLYRIPYKVFGGYRFYERKEIKDTLAYAKVAINTADTESLIRIINYPKRNIGPKTVEDLLEIAQEYHISLFTVLNEIDYYAPGLAKKVKPFVDIIYNLRNALLTKTPKEFTEYLIVESGIENDLLTSDDPDDSSRLENVRELVGAVEEFVGDNKEAEFIDYLQSATLISAADDTVDANYVSIATIHAVKGLEFDTVFIVALEENVFPSIQAQADPAELEEERRLMYVAITRAKHRLICTCANTRFNFNSHDRMNRSRFINEMKPAFDELRDPNAYGSFRNNYYSFDNSGYYSDDVVYSKKNHGYSRQSTSQVFAEPVKPLPKPELKTAAPKNDVDLSKFQEGIIVEHIKFGKGFIMKVEGEGEDAILSIAFNGLGVKKFALNIVAPMLTIVDK